MPMPILWSSTGLCYSKQKKNQLSVGSTAAPSSKTMESLLQVSTTPATPAVQCVILVAFDETPLRDPYDQRAHHKSHPTLGGETL